jgi:3D (Asp-Asp-Asp) domain-containing protein
MENNILKLKQKLKTKTMKKYYLTKKRKANILKAKWTVLLTATLLGSIICYQMPKMYADEIWANLNKNSEVSIVDTKIVNKSLTNDSVASGGVLREVTAYNAGIEAQTDASPCISASGDNICEMLARGEKICATNAFPLRTKLYIKNYGECVVLDRMNSRFKERVDIAMTAQEYQRAVNFGKQILEVRVIN